MSDIVEGPMGIGKTEAALSLVEKLHRAGVHQRGFYFALPTQLTSNRIHERVAPFVNTLWSNNADVRLAHSGAWLQDAKVPDPDVPEDDRVRSWFASAKKALLEPFGVGTVDQALLGMINVKHFFVRQFALAGKVVVIDEVHSYDTFTGSLVHALIKRLLELRCTVILLSATLTRTRLSSLVSAAGASLCDEKIPAYPRLTSVVEATANSIPIVPPPNKTVSIAFAPEDIAANAAHAIEKAKAGACVLWVLNTVARAQEAFCAAKAHVEDGSCEIGLLHSRFLFCDREEKEARWTSVLGKSSDHRPKGCVLVSTQIVEQSVDIDADYLITDLAPMDMFLQRIGRLWRHDRPNRSVELPAVLLCAPSVNFATASRAECFSAMKTIGRVYAPYLLARTLLALQARETISIPSDIAPLLEEVYSPLSPEPSALAPLRQEMEKEQARLSTLAQNALRIFSSPTRPDDEACTRLCERPSARLCLVCAEKVLPGGHRQLEFTDGTSCSFAENRWSLDAAKEIYRHSATVPRYAVADLLASAPSWLEKLADNTALGVLQPDGFIPGGNVQLEWSPDCGVRIGSKNTRTPQPTEDETWY
jgi:CRISPR-associated endonuclease/helicase Cas3